MQNTQAALQKSKSHHKMLSNSSILHYNVASVQDFLSAFLFKWNFKNPNSEEVTWKYMVLY